MYVTTLHTTQNSNIFHKNLVNLIESNATLKLKTDDISFNWNLFNTSKYFNKDSGVVEIPEDISDEVNSILKKKTKFFFLKKVINTDIQASFNLTVYHIFYKFFFTNNFINSKITYTTNKISFDLFVRKFISIKINFRNYEIFSKKLKTFFKKKTFFLFQMKYFSFLFDNITLRWYVSFKNKPRKYIGFKWKTKKYRVSKKQFRKKKFFSFFKKKRNIVLIYSKKTQEHIQLQNYNINTAVIGDFFFKWLMLKNISSFNENNYKLIFNSSSSETLNSHLYNCFFNNQNTHTHNKCLFNFTNLTPISTLATEFSKKIFSRISLNNIPNFYRYIYYTLANSIECILKKKFFLKILSISNTTDRSYQEVMDSIFLKNRVFQSKVGRGFFLHEMLDILYIAFLYKDLNLLMKWFIKTMYRVGFLKHKKLISTFKHILSSNSDFFLYNSGAKGFFFDIRGKVGVTGNAMARHMYFYVGDFTRTNKKNKFDYQFDIVKTHTGALGITMYLTY